MRKRNPMRGSRPLRVLGMVVVLEAVLGGALAAAEPLPRHRLPRHPVPPWGPFFGVPALPSPIPMLPLFPVPPDLPQIATTGPTDRCLVIPAPIDPRSLKVAESVDPGIFKEPRVQGLPVRTAEPTRTSSSRRR
ncbi:MAG: hypothetical protein QOE66_912 [Chloroflexota bacterium]|nr:hypothetical protein [Chloroflexota bacterium]